MQITQNDPFAGKVVIFDTILDEIAGGAGLNVSRLDYTNVDKKYLKAGAPLYFDPATRIAEVCKTALAIDGGGATTPRVGKNHHFKVGDLLCDGTSTFAITAISTTNTAYDVLTVASAVIYAAGTKYYEGAASGTSGTLAYTPNGLLRSDEYIADGNAEAPVVTIGTVRESALTYPLPDTFKVALRGGTAGTGKSLITVLGGA
jgi:hypothetical protein